MLAIYTDFVIKRRKKQILLSMKILRKIISVSLLFFLALTLITFGYYFAVTKNFSLQEDKLILNEKTLVLYDGSGEILTGANTSFLRQTVSADDLQKYTLHAFVDTEDRRFYQHGGFDFIRIARALVNNLRAGGFKEGASTISQQLVKNTHLTQEKTIKRKLREWKLTRQLEKKYTKKEILERYLNTIYFGHSCFGITSASNFYFNKSPDRLTLGESAILAGLVKSPNNYSPFRNPENCKKRKATVLNAMLRQKSITEKEKADAQQEPLPLFHEKSHNTDYLQFVFDELTTLSEEHGFTIGGKVEIGTYLDPVLQAETEKIASGISDCDKTILILDNKTRGFKSGISTLGNLRRLPGSLIKPLLVYAPALEENLLSPATPILDEKVNYGGYSPENYDGEYHGYVSARECVEKSLNVPAVKTLQALGIKKGAEYLNKLGLPVEKEDLSLALALGGMKNGFTLRDLVSAYSTLPCNGNYQNGSFISFVNVNGVPVYKRKHSPRQVFSKESAYLMTDMLKSTAKTGTAKKLRSLDFDLSAKTGTVGTSKGNTDAYALSYTTLDCACVWLGNADNGYIPHTGGGAPCNLLLEINKVLENRYQNAGIEITPFEKPENVTSINLDKISYYDTHTLSIADDLTPENLLLTEWFKKSAIPLNKSDRFTFPTIFPPEIKVENKAVFITFDKRFPNYYTYEITKNDYTTHTTLYRGKLTNVFVDEQVETGKSYTYYVTPFYGNQKGKTVLLPSVFIPEKLSEEESKMLEKEWWEY